MSRHEQDRQLDNLARRQHGTFHRRQALDLGYTPRQIDLRRRSGQWLVLTPSVYALASHPYSWLRQVKAAELSVPGSAVSHRAAARLHGMEEFRAGSIDLLASRTANHRTRLATVHRTDGFVSVRRQLVTVTTLPRTVADLAGVVDPWALERAVDNLLVSQKVTVDELSREATAASVSRRAGSGELRRLIDDRGDGYVPPASELEALLYRVLDEPTLPAYVRQSPFPWWPTAPQRIDALIPEWRLIVEGDGRRWHTRMADFERDLARDHLAKRRGYDVLRLTYRQLCGSTAYAIALLLDVGDHRRRAA